MIKSIKDNSNKIIIWAILLSLLSFPLGGCKHREKIFTIGIISYASILTPDIEGFKAGMADLGYIEGKNVKYIYNGVIENNQKSIDTEIKNLLSENIDLLLSVGNQVSIQANKAVEGTGIPLVFSAVTDPIANGLVKSMSHPGGNSTGVVNTDSTSKALEFLKMITPGLKKIYVPYNPDDEVSINTLSELNKIAGQLEIKLVLDEIHSVAETASTIKNLPKDFNAIFRIPSPTLDGSNSELNQAAIDRGIPMGSRVPLDQAVLITYSDDLYIIGKQTARLVHLILQGAKPADLPVETSETFLTINLKTAEKIGLHISDDVLIWAKIIVR